MDTLWAALALLLIVEGLFPFASPKTWRDTFRRLIELSDGQLRFLGFASIVLGASALIILHA